MRLIFVYTACLSVYLGLIWHIRFVLDVVQYELNSMISNHCLVCGITYIVISESFGLSICQLLTET